VQRIAASRALTVRPISLNAANKITEPCVIVHVGMVAMSGFGVFLGRMCADSGDKDWNAGSYFEV